MPDPTQPERRDQDLREFALEPRPRPSLAIRFLRLILWSTPAALVAGTFVLWQYTDITGWIIFPAPFLLTIAVGCFDGLVCTYLPKSEGIPIPKALAAHCLSFTWIQLLLAPAIAAGLLIAAIFITPLSQFF